LASSEGKAKEGSEGKPTPFGSPLASETRKPVIIGEIDDRLMALPVADDALLAGLGRDW
jgi:hypothetical protein